MHANGLVSRADPPSGTCTSPCSKRHTRDISQVRRPEGGRGRRLGPRRIRNCLYGHASSGRGREKPKDTHTSGERYGGYGRNAAVISSLNPRLSFSNRSSSCSLGYARQTPTRCDTSLMRNHLFSGNTNASRRQNARQRLNQDPNPDSRGHTSGHRLSTPRYLDSNPSRRIYQACSVTA